MYNYKNIRDVRPRLYETGRLFQTSGSVNLGALILLAMKLKGYSPSGGFGGLLKYSWGHFLQAVTQKRQTC